MTDQYVAFKSGDLYMRLDRKSVGEWYWSVSAVPQLYLSNAREKFGSILAPLENGTELIKQLNSFQQVSVLVTEL